MTATVRIIFCDRITMKFLVDQPACNRPVGVDAAVAQEGPVAAYVFERLHIHVADKDFLAIMRGFGEHATEGIAEERSAPKLESLARGRLAANVASLEADAIYDRDINAVGDRVGALDGAPGVVLRHAKFGLLRRVPADCCRIKKNLRALQCRQPCALGIPLIPADERAKFSGAGVERTESEIAWSEIKLLVVEGVVGDVHLAVEPA